MLAEADLELKVAVARLTHPSSAEGETHAHCSGSCCCSCCVYCLLLLLLMFCSWPPTAYVPPLSAAPRLWIYLIYPFSPGKRFWRRIYKGVTTTLCFSFRQW